MLEIFTSNAYCQTERLPLLTGDSKVIGVCEVLFEEAAPLFADQAYFTSYIRCKYLYRNKTCMCSTDCLRSRHSLLKNDGKMRRMEAGGGKEVEQLGREEEEKKEQMVEVEDERGRTKRGRKEKKVRRKK